MNNNNIKQIGRICLDNLKELIVNFENNDLNQIDIFNNEENNNLKVMKLNLNNNKN